MISTNQLLMALGSLFAIDIVMTFIAVGHMGATELNPLINVFGFSLAIFLKILVSAGAIFIFYKFAPRTAYVARPMILSLVVLYVVVAASNTYQLFKVVA